MMRKITISDVKLPVSSLPVLALLLGIFLRVVQYLGNRSIWIDEAWITLNILHRSFSQLFLPLDYDQGAPIGFLLGEKAIVSVLGRSEFALRLFPLLAGIGLILIFYPLAQAFTSRFAAVIGLFLLAVAHFLIYYASEVKQYSSDALVTGLLLFLYARFFNDKRIDPKSGILYGLLSAVILWFAHPSIFILGGIFIALFLKYLSQKDRSSLINLGIAALLTGLSFVLFYFVSLKNLNSSATLSTFWGTEFQGFIPFPPKSTADVQLYASKFLTMFQPTVGIGDRIPQLGGIAALLAIFGVFSFFIRDRYKAILFIAPIGLTLVASTLHKYPFADRLLLFLVPILVILIVEGIDFVRLQLTQRARLTTIIILIFVFWEPATRATTLINYHQEAKPTFAYIRDHFQPGDEIYVNGASQFVFQYYLDQYQFNDKPYIIGKYPETTDTLRADFAALHGYNKVWIVISNLNDTTFQPAILDNYGKQLGAYSWNGFNLYLYNMNTPPTASSQ